MEDTRTITEEELKKYYHLQQQKKTIDQEINQLKNTFHQVLDQTIGKHSKAEITCGQYTLKRYIRHSTNYHQKETIKKLSELNLEDFIQVIRRPDKEKLEAAIKLGLVDSEEFEPFRQTKITQALVVSVNDN